jgi:hypothetical protein
MSLLHRNLVAAAFQDMMRKIEPIAAETAEAVLSVVAPAAAPIATAAIETAEAVFGQTSSSHVDAAVAAASAPPAPATPSATPAAVPAPAAPAPVNLAADKSTAALAAVDALAMQLSQLATQLAAIRSNLVPSRPGDSEK